MLHTSRAPALSRTCRDERQAQWELCGRLTNPCMTSRYASHQLSSLPICSALILPLCALLDGVTGDADAACCRHLAAAARRRLCMTLAGVAWLAQPLGVAPRAWRPGRAGRRTRAAPAPERRLSPAAAPCRTWTGMVSSRAAAQLAQGPVAPAWRPPRAECPFTAPCHAPAPLPGLWDDQARRAPASPASCPPPPPAADCAPYCRPVPQARWCRSRHRSA